MDDKPDRRFDDFLIRARKLGPREAEQLYESIMAELERQVAFLKSKFKTEEAYKEVMAMLVLDGDALN
jgi:hypothetical protein